MIVTIACRHALNAEEDRTRAVEMKHGGNRVAQYNRNTGKTWTASEIATLRELAKQNTPTRIIGLKLGRTEAAVRAKASQEGIGLKPVNQSPYNRR